MLSLSARPPLILGLLFFMSYHSLAHSCRLQPECISAPFVPGYNLVGEGFDLVTLKKKSVHLVDVLTYLNPDGTCQIYKNPLQGNKAQKVPRSVVEWRSINSCTYQLDSSLDPSRFTKRENIDGKIGFSVRELEGLHVVGTNSSVNKFIAQKNKEDRHAYSAHQVSCVHYSYRVSDKPPLSFEFKRDLAALPTTYNCLTKNRYKRLIDTYGTHFIRQAELGGRFRRVTASRVCLFRLNGLSSSKVHSCLSSGISRGLGLSHSRNDQSCFKFLQNQDVTTSFSTGLHQHFTEVVGGSKWNGDFSLLHDDSQSFKEWQDSLKDNPDVVKYSLTPMYELVSHPSQKAGLKAEVLAYLKKNGERFTPRMRYCPYKPPYLDGYCCPKRAWSGSLTVTIIRAWNLRGDRFGSTEAYVKMWYGTFHRRTHIVRSNNPRWNAQYRVGNVDTRLGLKIEVWDEDVFIDDLLGRCTRYLEKGTHKFTCNTKYGGVEVSYTLSCVRNLTGNKCQNYQPRLY